MARATGIGGIFFRSHDTKATGAWYERWFGITAGGMPWETEAGMTVFAPFKADTDYFPAGRQFMINLRVDDLATLITDMRAAGIAVETRAEWDGTGEYGTFARITDPEGNPVELWQPPA
jgi:glyoxylase I family protein